MVAKYLRDYFNSAFPIPFHFWAFLIEFSTIDSIQIPETITKIEKLKNGLNLLLK